MENSSRQNRRFSRLRFRLAVVATALFALGLIPRAHADSTDVTVVSVTKAQLYQQTSPANPVAKTNPFTFNAAALASRANSIASGQVQPPGGTVQNMNGDGRGNFFFDGGNFATLATLNTAFPNGLYNFLLQTVTAPTLFNPRVTLTGDSYPATVPKITNTTWSSGGLQVDATQNFTFTWSAFAGFSQTDSEIILQVVDAANNIVFTQSFVYPNNPTSLTMVKGILQPGQYYTASLIFENRQLSSNGSTSLRPVYLVQTDFKIATISGPPVLNGPNSVIATLGQLFVYQVIASNHPASYGATALPAGLTFNSTLGTITGVPTSTGTTQIQLSATNADGVGFANLTIQTILPNTIPSLTIISGTSAYYYAGQPFTFQVVTHGATANARLSATGLPPGLSVNPVTGVISGVTNSTGSFLVTLTLTDGNASTTATLQLTFTTDGGYPVMTNANTVIVPRGQPFSYTIATPGVSDPNDSPSFTMAGTLPQGLSFNPAAGTISGTYTGPMVTGNINPSDSGGDPPEVKRLSGGALLGSIQLFGTNSHGSSTFQLLFLAPPSGAVNISTRLFVSTGDNVLIGGFIITGNAPKVVIIRALGPSTGVPGALQDPVLELHSGSNVVINDNWRTGTPNQEQIIKDTTIPPTDDRESAIVAALDPGNYTAIVSGKNGSTGIALVEVYDLGTASLDSTSKAQLAQISTRGNVLTGDNVMIGGFFISGVTTKILVRAIGPSLSNFGVTNPLQDPTLELHDGSGTTIRSNDNWKIREDGSSQQAEVEATTVPPTDDRESAIVQSLVPGPYTAIVRGKNGTTGVALVEVYALQ
jgi:hypothetical protein